MLRLPLYFALFGLVWIWGSDSASTWLNEDLTGHALFQSLKGSFFVLATSLFIWVICRRAVASLLHAQARLRRTNEDYRRMLDALRHHAFFYLSADGHVRAWNRGAEEMTGWSEVESLGQPYALLFPDEAREEGLPALHLEQASLQGEYESVGLRRRRDGSLLRARAVITCIEDETGRPDGFACLLRDASARESLEQEVENTRRLELLGSLVASVAHDFNNVLTAILGHLDFALSSLPEEAPGRSEVSEARAIGVRASHLSRQLVGLSRQPEAAEFQVLDANRLLSELEATLQRLLPPLIRIETDLAAAPSLVEGHAGLLEQLLLNLALNARDAMPAGGRLTLRTGSRTLEEKDTHPGLWEQPGEYVIISVEDTGNGMDSNTLGRIFEPFFTTKPPGKGTGLGLAMAYRAARAHDGFFRVDSKPGHGTTFQLFLPTARTQEASPDHHPPEETRGQEVVLLAEDEPSLRRLATRYLESLGYTVLVAGDGREAVDLLKSQSQRIGCMIVDAVMPHLDGKGVIRAARELSLSLPVLMVSGFSREEALEGLTGTSFLPKPYRLPELAQAVREAISRHAALGRG